MTFFDLVDYISQNIMLPLGGLLIALFAVWILPKAVVTEQLDLSDGMPSLIWKLVGGVVAPIGVRAIFIYTILPLFSTSG